MNSAEKGAWGPRDDHEASAARWLELNDAYDKKIAHLYANPTAELSKGDLIVLRSMQKELFELESELLKKFEN